MSRSLGELALQFGCELRGDPAARVARVATLESADESAVAFVADRKYTERLKATSAGCVVLAPEALHACPVAALVHPNPHAVFARIATLLHPAPLAAPGMHSSASVHPLARIHPSAYVAAMAVIGEHCVLGERAVVGAGSVLGAGAELGADTRLVARVTLGEGVVLGRRVLVHPGAVIGADGFGYARDGAQWVKVPQLGTVRIGDDVEIGANTTIDRGALDDTIVGEGVKLDNQIQIGHNVRVGAHTIMAGCVAVAGSTHIGARCVIAGGVGIVGHLQICDEVTITVRALVSTSIDKPGVYSGTIPAREATAWRRLVAHLGRLPHYVERLKRLERRAGLSVDERKGESADD